MPSASIWSRSRCGRRSAPRFRTSSLEPLLAAEGVVQADTDLQAGETIRPVQRDGDRRGYVIAVADTSVQALDRAEAAARLLEVEVE